jgi:prepilin-type N-terminal cleavage/methylation domain-containing protein
MKTTTLVRRRRAFTLIEVMLVVAIISLLATLAIPNYLRARKRAQATRLYDDLRAVDHAMELYTIEHRRSGDEMLTPSDVEYLKLYVKDRTHLYQSLPNDMFQNPFKVTNLKTIPTLSIATFNVLSDVVPLEFWSPYTPVE